MKSIQSSKIRLSVSRWAFALLLIPSIVALAVPPDLTNGGVPTTLVNSNLGPTGLRGWVDHVNEDSSQSRQILVQELLAGSPAVGIVAVGDVILGADGTGANPVNFTADARRSFANAINDAEARTPAALKVLRWRAGTTTTQTLTLRTMGAYSATAPYNCPKSAKILEEGLQAIMTTGETAGTFSLGTLALLAGNNPTNPNNAARQLRAQTEARALILSAATMARMTSGDLDELGPNAFDPWEVGHTLIVLTEYYLRTNDALVLPTINALSRCTISGQNVFGTYSHRYASKWRDGSPNGPMRNYYGTVNSASMPGWLGLLLTKECGVVNPDLDPAIERASRFYGYYAGKGSIPYGEHIPYASHENNGKSGLAALCFELESQRTTQQKMFAKMAVAATWQRELGHTGPYFNYLWSPLGAAAGGETAAASHFSRIRWLLDLNRRHDGTFAYDCINSSEWNENFNDYYGFKMSTAAVLLYALPLRQLHITGRGHDPLRWLSAGDVAEAAAADGDYVATNRSTSQLVADLGSWSPRVTDGAALELKNRPSETTALLPSLHAKATDPLGTSRVGATLALGYIGHASSAGILAALLTDPVNHVRLAAAQALTAMPQNARLPQLNTVLAAAVSTAAPLLPFNAEDPAQLTHSLLGPLLFGSGGMVPSNLAGMDRNLVFPAIRAIARNPVGNCRSSLAGIYNNLNQSDYQTLADTVVYSAYELTPADKMFAYQDRFAAQRVMERFNTAEGVPLCLLAVKDAMYGDMTQQSLSTLQLYAGSSKTVVPDPGVEAAMNFLIQTGTNAAEAQAVLTAIAGDPNPVPLQPLKSIQSATADSPTLTLPAKSTILRVAASDLAKGDSIYTWRKIHGAGNVTIAPNGTAAAKEVAVVFDNTPGLYRFEVKMSDSKKLTEVYSTVVVTLYQPGGTLPPNSPPDANNQSLSFPQDTATPITLTGSDPEGYALNYRLTSQPTQGKLTGTAPYLVYTSNLSYTGPDGFTFEVTDSEGQVSAATVSLTVTADNNPALPALAGNGTTGNLIAYDGYTNGYRFQTGSSALTVKWLGFYDAPNSGITGTVGDGLQTSHLVSIWRESDGVLMAQTTVLTSDALVGSFRRHDIPPVTLAANTGYVIAAAAGATNEDRLWEAVNTSEWGIYSGISNLAGRYGGGGMPQNGWSVLIGPNFGYAVVPIDIVSPSPNPTAFHQAPASAGPNSISMVAVTAFDPNNVEYYFTCTAGGGDDSGWQDSPSYTDTGLTPGVLYSYTVKARDKSPARNQTTPSAAASATISTQTTLPNLVGINRASAEVIIPAIGMIVGNVTISVGSGLPLGTVLSQTPVGNQTQPLGTVVDLVVSGGDSIAPTPNPATFSIAPAATNSSTITMTATTGSDASGVQYLFTETSGSPGGSSSAWQDSPVFTDTGLAAATSYSYTLTLRDKSPNSNQTAPSAPLATTTAPIPVALELYSAKLWTIGRPWATADNPNAWVNTDGSPKVTNQATLTIEAGETAGVWPTDVWDNINVRATNTATITSSAAGTATLTVVQRRNESSYNWTTLRDGSSAVSAGNLAYMNDGNATLFDGHLVGTEFDGPSGPVDPTRNAVIQVTGLTFPLYDVFIYFGINEGYALNGFINFNNGGPTAFTLPAAQPSTTLDEIESAGATGNYIKYSNVTGSSFSARIYGQGFNHLGPSGIQICKVAALPRITSFGIPGSTGVIDQTAKTISLTVPFGTNLTTLAPIFTLSSGTCNRTSGSPPSPTFASANPATYTVTDGATVNTYTVTVSVTPGPQPSTTTLVSSPVATGPYGTSVTFTAICNASATGMVTFTSGATVLGSGLLTAGIATFNTSALAVANHSITATYNGDTNFTGSVSTPVVYGVTAKSLTITGVAAGNKVYDGNANAALTGGTIASGVISGETATVIPGSGTFASANAGTWAVTATAFSLGGTHAGNYQLSAQPTVPNATITPRPVQLTGMRIYNATVLAAAADLTISDKVNGDDLTLTGSTELASKDVGTRALLVNHATPARVQSKTGFSTASTSTSFSVTLNAAPTNGNTLIAVISSRGTSANRVTGILSTGATWARVTQSTNSSGSTTEIWSAPVGPGAATGVTISTAQGRCAGVVIEYSGILTANAVDQTAASPGATGTSPATGTTPITTQANELWIGGIGYRSSTPTLGSILNSFTSVASAQSSSSTAGNNAMVYALERIVSASGTASSGGTLSASVVWSGAIATFKAVSTSTLALSGTAAGNYTLIGLTGSVEITPKSLTITADTQGKTYGQTLAFGSGATQFTSIGLLDGETIGSVTLTCAGGDPAADAASYPITPSAATGGTFSSTNYAINYVPGLLTVSAVTTTTTLTSSGSPANYGDPVTLTATVVPTPVGGTVQFHANAMALGSPVPLSGGQAQLVTSTLAAGSHSITATYSGSTNHSGSTATAMAQTVDKATPAITTPPIATDITYGQTLASSTLSGGAGSVPGTFAFTNPATEPPVGTTTHGVTFTPADTDNYQTATTSVSVTVNAARTPFETWAADPARGLTEGMNDAPLDDPDYDGFSNLMEFVLGGAPMVSSQAIQPELTQAGGNRVFSYHRSHLSKLSTTQMVEYGSGLTGWTPLAIPADTAGAVTITPGPSSDRVEVSIPPQGANGFVRLKVVITP